MTEHNKIESGKLARGAKWVIRQLLFEIEARRTEIELHDAEEAGYVIYYKLISGDENIVEEYAQKLSIGKDNNRLEVNRGD
jgi:hypothetical protein